MARYKSRDDIYEWDCDWSLLPRTGLIQVVLCAPSGKSGVLGHSSQDISDRVFQFKIANTIEGRIAQVIGVVHNTRGDCLCYAYDSDLRGPFEDNISFGRFQYGGGVMAKPSYEALGIKL